MKLAFATLLSVATLIGSLAFAQGVDSERLAAVLAAQPEAVQARYQYRHPQETLEFFGIAPGMTVLEALPGRGWYTKILLPYLGKNGTLAGVDYDKSMYAKFGFFSEERLNAKETWVETWTAEAKDWRDADSGSITAFTLGTMPDSFKGKADAVLFIRALHNLARFENDGGYLTTAISNAVDALKPGGIVGVVQHQARPDMPDDWATGSKGYVKKAFIIEQMENAGLEFVAESEINANEKDQPSTDDIVWRLPPSFATSKKDPQLREKLQAVGESNRMTLKFRKPA